MIRAARALVFAGLASLAATACKGREPTEPFDLIEIATITIDTVAFAIERGTTATLRATVKNAKGDVVQVPVVWRSTQDTIAELDANGKLVARDTGFVNVTASSLGIVSNPLTVHVVWNGPASVEILPVDSGVAISPLAVLRDSIRVLVRNRLGVPLPGARVRFTATTGGGAVSPVIDTTDQTGRAATALTLGSSAGANVVTVAAIDEVGDPLTRVTGNPRTFSVTSYTPISQVAGEAQTAQILADLPVVPVVRLVDATGAPRAGVPVTFTATRGGRVEVQTASTGSDGTATPGTWTLGDLPGSQQLVVKVESATLTFNATATGTPIYYTPAQIIAGAFSTCGLGDDQLARCWGQAPQNGLGDDTTSVATPTPTKGGITFSAVAGGGTHFCGVGTDTSIYCWGTNALADTSGLTVDANQPKRLGSAIAWGQVSAGSAHNCAIALDQTTYCWGSNSRGQLGDRTSTTRFKPTAVSGGFNFSAVSAGGAHTCGLDAAGVAYCWGFNQAGQIGDGSTSDRNGPTLVNGTTKYKSIGTGDVTTCGLSLAGVAWCWGALAGSPAPVTAPQSMEGTPTLTSLSVGGGHACAIDAAGVAYCWGANAFGQVGDSSTTARPNPVKVATTLRFSSISAGFAHTCGRTIEGPIACWGRNRAGEHGDRIVTFRTTPRYVVLGVNP